LQIDWAVRYWERRAQGRAAGGDDFGDFFRDFEWMGVNGS
jgi:aminoglycoside/choline kinase family phosphotransferase